MRWITTNFCKHTDGLSINVYTLCYGRVMLVFEVVETPNKFFEVFVKQTQRSSHNMVVVDQLYLIFFSGFRVSHHINKLVEKKFNSIADALELNLFCTDDWYLIPHPLIYLWTCIDLPNLEWPVLSVVSLAESDAWGKCCENVNSLSLQLWGQLFFLFIILA